MKFKIYEDTIGKKRPRILATFALEEDARKYARELAPSLKDTQTLSLENKAGNLLGFWKGWKD